MMEEAVLPFRWRWPVYLLAAFPIVDYFLGIYPWGIIGHEWDKILFILFAFYAMRSYMVHGRKTVYPTYRYIIFLAVLGLGYIVMDVGYLTVAVAGYQVDFMYMLLALTLPYVVAKEDIVPLLKFVVLTGFLMGIHGVYEYVIKAPVPAQWIPIGQHERTRVYSLFGSPNIFGSYAAFITPLAISFAVYEKERAQRIFYALAALITTATTVFTFTRGAWVGLVVGILIVTWMIDKRWTFVAIGVTVLAVLFVHPIQVRIEQFLSPVYWWQTINNGRIARWIHAYDRMVANPFFGAGLGRYGGAIASRYFGITYVDGYYAKTLGELGLVGLFAFVALLFVYLRDVWRVWKKTVDPQMKILIAGVFSALIVLVVHDAVENVFEDSAMNMLFWLVGTLVLIYGDSQEVKRRV